jgi:hypothetical protein
MALHRDIYWVGRQWAVTGYGLQACNQKQKSRFDIEASELWEDSVLESIRAETWLNVDDFEKALAVARTHYPALAPQRVSGPKQAELKQTSRTEIVAEVSTPVPQKFELRVESWPAKFVQQWRIRVQR